MKKNLTKIVMLALCLCMMVAMFVTVASATEAEAPAKDLSEAEVTLDKYYSFYNGLNPEIPVLTVKYGGETLVEGTDYTVSVTYNDSDFAGGVAKICEAGRYEITVTAKGDTYTGSALVRYFVVSQKLGSIKVTASNWTYGEEAKAPEVVAKDKENKNWFRNDFALKVVEYCAIDKDGNEITPYSEEVPTEAGLYRVRVTGFRRDYYNLGTDDFEIEKKTISIKITDDDKVYGEKDPEKFEYTTEDAFEEGDDVKIELERAKGETVSALVGTYAITAELTGADAANYELDYEMPGKFTINQRVLSAADFVYATELTYNGKIQVPVITISTEDGRFAEEIVDLQVIGGRKYSGKYEAKIVALYDENYVLAADEIVLPYEIVGGTDKDAVIEDVADKFDFIKVSAPAIAPVVETIVKNIWTGVKAGVSALLKDFVSRVFA